MIIFVICFFEKFTYFFTFFDEIHAIFHVLCEKFCEICVFYHVFHEKYGEISEIHLIFHLFLVKIRENVNFRETNFSCEFSSSKPTPTRFENRKFGKMKNSRNKPHHPLKIENLDP